VEGRGAEKAIRLSGNIGVKRKEGKNAKGEKRDE